MSVPRGHENPRGIEGVPVSLFQPGHVVAWWGVRMAAMRVLPRRGQQRSVCRMRQLFRVAAARSPMPPIAAWH